METLALAEINRVPVLIGQNLHFDVPRIDDRLLDIDFAVAERSLRLAARALKRRLQFLGRNAPGACPCLRRPRRLSA